MQRQSSVSQYAGSSSNSFGIATATKGSVCRRLIGEEASLFIAITSKTTKPVIIGRASTGYNFLGYTRNFASFTNSFVEPVTNSTVITQPVFS